MKRIFLFVATNFAIMIMLSIVLSLLGVTGYITADGLDYAALMVFSLVWGFGGAGISLLMSRWLAKTAMGVQLVDGRTGQAELDWMYQTVEQLTRKAGLPMPEVGIYDSPEVNAFATGPSKRSSLVAVSSGLLRSMRHEEIEGVLAHEVSHIQNGDMVTMTLIQGVMNTFVVFLSRVIGYIVDGWLSRGEQRSGPGIGYFVTTIVLDILLGFLAAIIVAWFSRQREFRADRGSAQLMGRRQPMINALARLGGMVPGELPKSIQAFGITSGVGKLFSTHPPIEERIAALQQSA